jgi:hypothetical protein
MRVAWRLAPHHKHLEVPIGFLFCESRPPIQEKLCDALDLLASASHQYLKRLRRHIRGILIMPLGTAVGEFFPPLKLCCLDEKHVSSDSTMAEDIAATLGSRDCTRLSPHARYRLSCRASPPNRKTLSSPGVVVWEEDRQRGCVRTCEGISPTTGFILGSRSSKGPLA